MTSFSAIGLTSRFSTVPVRLIIICCSVSSSTICPMITPTAPS